MLSFGLIKRAVLELINQFTVAGEEVPITYNNQADYVRRIPALINQAIMKIRTTVLPDRRAAELSDGERTGDWLRFPLPVDCRSPLSGGVRRKTERGLEPELRCQFLGRSILLPDSPGTENRYFVEYLAYPVQLPADPEDDFELSEAPEVLQAAEYYAAAQLVMMEDAFSYAALMNEYQSRLAAMVPPVTATVRPVRDVYGPDSL